MTENGTFIISGTERVIVSQLHRSPGAFFHEDRAEKEFVGQIIPCRGSWVEFKCDAKNLPLRQRRSQAQVPGDGVPARAGAARGRRDHPPVLHGAPAALGGSSVQWGVSDALVGLRSRREVKIPGADITIGEGKKITVAAVAALRKAGVSSHRHRRRGARGRVRGRRRHRSATGEVLLEANEELTERAISMAQEKAIEHVDVFFPEADEVGPVVSLALSKDAIETHEEALVEIYRRLRPGDPPNARQQPIALREHVLQPAETGFLAGGPHNQHEAEAEHAARREDPAPAGLLRGHQVLLKLRRNR